MINLDVFLMPKLQIKKEVPTQNKLYNLQLIKIIYNLY